MPGNDDKNAKELVDKLARLAKARNETPEQLFLSYDKTKDSALSKSELTKMLSDANVGNPVTRWKWVNEIFKRVDADGSGLLTLSELRGILQRNDPPAPGGLTRAEARAVAMKIAAGGKPDLSKYSQADLALIEEENLALTKPINPQPKVPPIPPRASGGGGGGALVILLVLGLWMVSSRG